jgi:septal ring factor EnvC (AmiA/AmiB activator)
MTSQPWTLSKNIPAMFLFALGLQFVYFVSFITELEAGISNNEREIERQSVKLNVIEKNVQGQQVSLARIDENIRHIRETVDKVLNKDLL